MPLTIVPGFMGYAEIGSYKVRCTDFNVQLAQKPVFYDHIIGLRDSIPTDILGSKKDDGMFNEQKIFWRGSTKIVEGTINFPMTSESADAFFSEAYSGDEFDMSLYYACDKGADFKSCRVNTYSFTATAGEGVNVSVGIMGKEEDIGGSPSEYTEAEKIITWDSVSISGTDFDDAIMSFEFTINNNCIPIYTSGTNNTDTGSTSTKLLAHAIRVGMQTVTGSVTFFNDYGPAEVYVEDATEKTISIDVGGRAFAAELTVVFEHPQRTGQVSPYIKVIPFAGVATAVQP
jgi:hypothetical protein